MITLNRGFKVVLYQVLAELLSAREPIFSLAIRQLEAESGRTGADIRLANEIEQKVKLKTKELGLDPEDTSGKELHHALIDLIKKHEQD